VRQPLLVLVLVLASSAFAQGRWSVELYTGTSFKPPTTLEIRQEGHPDAVIGDVRYETRPWLPFESLVLLTENYYLLRVGYQFAPVRPELRLGVELEFLHDKAYYVTGHDPDGVVQHFELSDGLNLLLLNGVATVPFLVEEGYPDGRGQLIGRLGVGPVITKPAATIRDQEYGHDLQGRMAGYDVTGPGVAAAVQARWFLEPWLTMGVETKLSYAATTSRIANGYASTNVPALHVVFGFGVHP
jgi:hypothetical protein